MQSVNGAKPDENGNVEVEVPEGFSGSWNDLTDRPFGEETTVIEWDGVVGDRAFATAGDTFQWVKVSDLTSIDDVIGGAVSFVTNVESIELPENAEITVEGSTTYDGGTLVLAGFSDLMIAVVTQENAKLASMTFPETGLYFPIITNYGQFVRVSALEYTTLTQLDPKFIPDSVGGSGVEIPEPSGVRKQLITDGNGNMVWEDRSHWRNENLNRGEYTEITIQPGSNTRLTNVASYGIPKFAVIVNGVSHMLDRVDEGILEYFGKDLYDEGTLSFYIRRHGMEDDYYTIVYPDNGNGAITLSYAAVTYTYVYQTLDDNYIPSGVLKGLNKPDEISNGHEGKFVHIAYNDGTSPFIGDTNMYRVEFTSNVGGIPGFLMRNPTTNKCYLVRVSDEGKLEAVEFDYYSQS